MSTFEVLTLLFYNTTFLITLQMHLWCNAYIDSRNNKRK